MNANVAPRATSWPIESSAANSRLPRRSRTVVVEPPQVGSGNGPQDANSVSSTNRPARSSAAGEGSSPVLQSQLNQRESSWSRPFERRQPNSERSPWRSTSNTRARLELATVAPRLAQIRWRSFFVAAAAGCAEAARTRSSAMGSTARVMVG